MQLAKHASVLSETRYGFALNELAAWPETADSDRKSALTSRAFIMASLASSHCKYFVSGRQMPLSKNSLSFQRDFAKSMPGYIVVALG